MWLTRSLFWLDAKLFVNAIAGFPFPDSPASLFIASFAPSLAPHPWLCFEVTSFFIFFIFESTDTTDKKQSCFGKVFSHCMSMKGCRNVHREYASNTLCDSRTFFYCISCSATPDAYRKISVFLASCSLFGAYPQRNAHPTFSGNFRMIRGFCTTTQEP